MFRHNFSWADAQQSALNFLISQLTIIEPQVYRIQYPELQHPRLTPIDNSGNEWAKSITFFSMDRVGRAQWFHHTSQDVPVADITREKFEQGVEMAAIGYRYTLEELGQAMLLPNMNLTAERADAARRAYLEFVEEIALRGDTNKQWDGLINQSTVIVATDVPADGTGSSRYWPLKTAELILRDINLGISGIWIDSNTVEYANTLLLPLQSLIEMSQRQMGVLPMTILDWVKQRNAYTFETGQPLEIIGVRGLESAGSGGTGRMVAYRRDQQVLKLHIPMPHKFLPVWQEAPLMFAVPGIFRLGGLQIRRPSAIRYIDKISAPV